MATAGDVVDEDLGRMNPPFGRSGTDGSRLRRWSQGQCRSSLASLKSPSRPWVVDTRQNAESRHRDIAKPHSRSQNKGLGSQMPGH